MDRDAIAAQLRRVYAHVEQLPAEISAEIQPTLNEIARRRLGPSFRFEPDLDRTTDAAPARMSGLRPAAPAQPARATLSVIPGGAERPSDRYLDDSADDAPKAG